MADFIERADAPTYFAGAGVHGGPARSDSPGATTLHPGDRCRRVGVLADVVADYTDALGPAGVARLRGLINEELHRLPRLPPGKTGDLHHSTILALAERALGLGPCLRVISAG